MKLLAVVILLSAFTSLAVMEVVDSFKQTCPQFFINEQPPTATIGVHQKQICQRWENIYHYATLYDVKLRIPVYSAYTFTQRGGGKRNEEWKNEPQLDDIVNGNKSMEFITDNKRLEKLKNQAIDNDYKNKPYTRGHVFPKQYAQNRDQADSTFALTNIAPQTKTSNNNWEAKVETPMLTVIQRDCALSVRNPAYIVTGVVPGNRWIEIKRGNKTYKGINIPSYYWTAFCCTNAQQNRVSGAYLGKQNNDDDIPVFQMTVKNLNTELSKKYKTQNFKVFGDECLN